MIPTNLTRMHVMALIYLALADIDDDATENEMSLAITKLREWQANDQMAVTKIIKESFEWYMGARDENRIGSAIENNLHVFEDFDMDYRKAMLGDMIGIMKADGKIDPRESKFFGVIADCLGVDLG